MRNPELRQRVREFLRQASNQLAVLAQEENGVPFDVAEEPGSNGLFYSFKPQIERFVQDRFEALEQLPGYVPALVSVSDQSDLVPYLQLKGHRRPPAARKERARLTLRELLADVLTDLTEIELVDERFERTYNEFEESLYRESSLLKAIFPIKNLQLESSRLAVEAGLDLIREEALEDRPEGIDATSGIGFHSTMASVVSYTVEFPAGSPLPLSELRAALERLTLALRLFSDGTPRVASCGWVKVDDGSWQSLPLMPLHRTDGSERMAHLTADSELELRAFTAALGRRLATDGPTTWALRRYDLGLQRPDCLEALSDYTMVLRALLGTDGCSEQLLAERLSAICELPHERENLVGKLLANFKLEQDYIGGRVIANQHADRLITAFAEHLKAVLRDLICGHLDRELISMADKILAQDSQALELSR